MSSLETRLTETAEDKARRQATHQALIEQRAVASAAKTAAKAAILRQRAERDAAKAERKAANIARDKAAAKAAHQAAVARREAARCDTDTEDENRRWRIRLMMNNPQWARQNIVAMRRAREKRHAARDRLLNLIALYEDQREREGRPIAYVCPDRQRDAVLALDGVAA